VCTRPWVRGAVGETLAPQTSGVQHQRAVHEPSFAPQTSLLEVLTQQHVGPLAFHRTGVRGDDEGRMCWALVELEQLTA
jgi:hypothetical protein